MPPLSRRAVLLGAASLAAMPAVAAPPQPARVRHNLASFRVQDWRPHFRSLRGGAILVDIDSRVLHHWEEDGTHRLYPSSVPMTDRMTRRGRTRVVDKVEGPSWRPTPRMLRDNPDWPRVVPPGPDNPLGSHALYLGWTYYRIHGTHDPEKIGRRSSAGCIGLYNRHIAEVFGRTRRGTQVLLI